MIAQRRKTVFLQSQARNFAADPWLGHVIAGEFELLELLGVGAQGRVYRAKQRPFDRPVAVKIFAGDAIATDEARVRAFREAQALGVMSGPGIPCLLRFGHLEADGRLTDGYFMAFELVRGGSLRALLDGQGRVEPLRALRIARGLLRVLAEMHRHGIAHRDLKPSHVMLTRDAFGAEQVTVIDFGIARRQGGFAYEGDGPQAPEAGHLVGSPAYLCPDPVTDGGVAGPAGDQYSVGIMLFEMLTGHLPFDGNMQAVLMGHLMRPLPALPSDLDPTGALGRLLVRATAKRAADRFADPGEMDRAVAAIIEGIESHGAPRPAPEPPSDDPCVTAPLPSDDPGVTMKLPPAQRLRPERPALLAGHTRQVIAGIVLGVMAVVGSAAGAALVSGM